MTQKNTQTNEKEKFSAISPFGIYEWDEKSTALITRVQCVCKCVNIAYSIDAITRVRILNQVDKAFMSLSRQAQDAHGDATTISPPPDPCVDCWAAEYLQMLNEIAKCFSSQMNCENYNEKKKYKTNVMGKKIY